MHLLDVCDCQLHAVRQSTAGIGDSMLNLDVIIRCLWLNPDDKKERAAKVQSYNLEKRRRKK